MASSLTVRLSPNSLNASTLLCRRAIMKIVKGAAVAIALSAGFVASGVHAQTRLTIGAAGTAVASLFAAKEEGFFAKRGVDATIVVVKLDPDMPAALLAHSLD